MRALAPLPITGVATLSALGSTREETLDALRHGRTGLKPPEDGWLPFETAVGAVSAPLADLESGLSPWTTRIARMAAHLIGQLEEPLAAARRRHRSDRIGVLLGTSTAGAESTEHAYRRWVETGALPVEFDFRRQHTFGAVLHVVRELTGATGPSWMVSTACTSSAKPFATARRLVAAGVIDAAVVGGFDTLCTMTLTGFHALGALDKVPCRPFSSERHGISIGEGGALAVVDRDGDARVLVEGVGESSDAYHVSAPHPEGRGAIDAMSRAIEQAGCKASDVEHVNAHGTGTGLNDRAEARAIRALIEPEVPVVSTKGYTGHTLGAAGALEVAFASMVIEEGWIPPSIHAEPLEEGLGIRVATSLTQGRVTRVLSNSFAFGGNNVSVLLRAP